MLIRACAFTCGTLFGLTTFHAHAEAPVYRYVALTGGELQLAGQSQSTYAGEASMALGRWIYLRAHADSSDGASIDIDRQSLDVGLRLPMNDWADLIFAIGGEWLHSSVRLQTDFVEPGGAIHAPRNESNLAVEAGLRLRPWQHWDVDVALRRHAPDSYLFYNLPEYTARVELGFRVSERFQVRLSATSGEDYREFMVGPRIEF